jgi:hypothetical protein
MFALTLNLTPVLERDKLKRLVIDNISSSMYRDSRAEVTSGNLCESSFPSDLHES